MITKDEIFKMVSKITRHGRGIKEKQLINPEREWAIAVLVFTILLLGGFWYNATLFSYYHNIEDNLPNETVNIPNYNYGALSKVLERYDERAKQFDEIKSGIVPVAPAVVIVSTTTASTTAAIEDLPLATTTDSVENSSTTIFEVVE